MGNQAPNVHVHTENESQDNFLMYGIGVDEVQDGSYTLPTEALDRYACGADFDSYDEIQAEIEMKRHDAAVRARSLIAKKRRDATPWQMVRLS